MNKFLKNRNKSSRINKAFCMEYRKIKQNQERGICEKQNKMN